MMREISYAGKQTRGRCQRHPLEYTSKGDGIDLLPVAPNSSEFLPKAAGSAASAFKVSVGGQPDVAASLPVSRRPAVPKRQDVDEAPPANALTSSVCVPSTTSADRRSCGFVVETVAVEATPITENRTVHCDTALLRTPPLRCLRVYSSPKPLGHTAF